MSNKKTVNWNVPVGKGLDQQVEDSVAAGSHASKSELIRDAVRRLLEKEKQL